MTREDAIIALGDRNSLLWGMSWEEQKYYSKALEMAISALKDNKGKEKWIPVSKRLPDEEHEVYCQLSDGSNAVLYIQDNWGQMEWVDGMMGTGTYDVVAWREKPEPYKKRKR